MWNNNVFPLLTSSRETCLNDFSFLDNSDLVRSIFLDGDFCFIWWDEKNQKMATINDTFNTRWLNDDELIQVIKSKIWVNIRTVEWIEKINLLFSESVDFLHNVLYRNVWNDIKHKKDNYFSTNNNESWILWNDIIKFLRETEKWKRVSQTHCRIAKVVYWVNDVLENPEIVESENNAKNIIQTEIVPWIQIEDFNMLMNYNQSNCTIVLNWKIIKFKLKFRWKEDASALLKIIYNPEYNGAELLSDPIGMELVCENEEDIALLFNHFYTVLFWEKIDEMRHKEFNMDLMASLPWLSEKFIKELWKSIWKKKDSSHKSYMDLKMLWRIKWYLVEFRAKVKCNEEKDILESDEVYYLWKILLAMIRLDWYITENYIKLVINKFYEKYPEVYKKLNKEHLLDYLIKPLIQIDRWVRCNLYTSNDRYETLNYTEFYPENFKKVG
jgi:hypothetical protein